VQRFEDRTPSFNRCGSSSSWQAESPKQVILDHLNDPGQIVFVGRPVIARPTSPVSIVAGDNDQ
jgi:hypothetical protein